jgi:hypothetical protein
MSIPAVFPPRYWKVLTKGAKKLGVTRAKLAMAALCHYLKFVQKKNAPAAKALGSAELAKHVGEAHSKIAKKWWSTISEEERRFRAQKAIQARWGKTKKAGKEDKQGN